MLITQAVVDGILTGGVYALMASGLTLVFGVMDIINIAQGALVVLGAYLSYALSSNLHIDLFVGLLVTIPVMFALGLFIHYVLIRPIKRDRAMMSLLMLFAIAIISEGILGLVFTTNFVQLHAWYTTASMEVHGIFFGDIYVFSFALAAVLLAALGLLLYRSQFGRSLRATMQNRTAAMLVGVDIERVSAITLGIGIGLAAAGGMAFGATNDFDPGSSYDLISRLLVIVILGGLGSVGGALVAAVFMLVIEDIIAVVWSPVWGQTTFYIVLVLLLLLRPQGLFGHRAVRAQ